MTSDNDDLFSHDHSHCGCVTWEDFSTSFIAIVYCEQWREKFGSFTALPYIVSSDVKS